MGWIHQSKRHTTAKRWYCSTCDKRTPIDFNPEWVEDGKPTRWDGDKYEWFTRCAVCKECHWSGEYECPNCGCDIEYEQEPIKATNPAYNIRYSYEFGVEGYDWDELHQCRKCRSHFWIRNSNC